MLMSFSSRMWFSCKHHGAHQQVAVTREAMRCTTKRIHTANTWERWLAQVDALVHLRDCWLLDAGRGQESARLRTGPPPSNRPSHIVNLFLTSAFHLLLLRIAGFVLGGNRLRGVNNVTDLSKPLFVAGVVILLPFLQHERGVEAKVNPIGGVPYTLLTASFSRGARQDIAWTTNHIYSDRTHVLHPVSASTRADASCLCLPCF